jgi:hypothetical protein
MGCGLEAGLGRIGSPGPFAFSNFFSFFFSVFFEFCLKTFANYLI